MRIIVLYSVTRPSNPQHAWRALPNGIAQRLRLRKEFFVQNLTMKRRKSVTNTNHAPLQYITLPHFFVLFSPTEVPSTHRSTENSNEMNDIPSDTRSLFIPPEFPTKEARQLQYFASGPEVPVPGHVHRILHEAPFFDTIDHAKPVLALQQRRKYAGLAPLVLKSIRPYFPFFAYE